MCSFPASQFESVLVGVVEKHMSPHGEHANALGGMYFGRVFAKNSLGWVSGSLFSINDRL